MLLLWLSHPCTSEKASWNSWAKRFHRNISKYKANETEILPSKWKHCCFWKVLFSLTLITAPLLCLLKSFTSVTTWALTKGSNTTVRRWHSLLERDNTANYPHQACQQMSCCHPRELQDSAVPPSAPSDHAGRSYPEQAGKNEFPVSGTGQC